MTLRTRVALSDQRGVLEDLLERTSRTFALAIPMLPEPRRAEVMVAYLLFRIADTLEDAAVWSRDQRTEALERFVRLLEHPTDEEAERAGAAWAAARPSEHEGYLELLEQTPLVMDALMELDAGAADIIRAHTIRTAAGMAGFVALADAQGTLRLQGLEALRDYCYAVAGIVGEMLTELFLLEHRHLRAVGSELRGRARFFGEALQLVNILRDAADDEREGRCLIDRSLDREALLRLAHRDLRAAAEYTLAMQQAGAPEGFLSFTAVPVRLAIATLEAVRRDGPGAKIGRARVWAIVRSTRADLAAGRPPVPPTGWHSAEDAWKDGWMPTLPPAPWDPSRPDEARPV